MSTVQSILDDIQFRADVTQDLYHLLNLAVRSLAKRLYWHKSKLLVGDLAVAISASTPYTASTIAFVNSNPDTLTDSANGFVTAGFKSGMSFTTDATANPGPFKIDVAAAGTLTLISTDAVVAAGAGSAVILTPIDDYGILPSDFWGLVDRPYVSGRSYPLLPIPNQATLLAYAVNSAGLALYYDIRGTKIYLVPRTSEDVTIKGQYWQRPTALTGTSDTIPFNELFDDIISEVLVQLYNRDAVAQGEAIGICDKIIREGVDPIVARFGLVAPTQMPVGIDWEGMLV
jgi:hypothetical protein